MASSKPASKGASSTLVILFRLIEANDWQKLNWMFLADPEGRKTFQYLARVVAKSSSFNGMTILHAIARFNPPSSLVARIIELCPDAPSSQDCMKRTPLHVAAGTGANTSVIKVLSDAHPEANMIQDSDGRTPLHMASDSNCELFEDNRGRHRGLPSYRTIGVLLSANLNSAVLEDEDGMSAIEYVLLSNADMPTVRLIQRAAQKVMLNKKDAERAARVRAQAAGAKGFKVRKGRLSAPSA